MVSRPLVWWRVRWPAVMSSGLESVPRPWGRLTDHIGLGVLSARFWRSAGGTWAASMGWCTTGLVVGMS